MVFSSPLFLFLFLPLVLAVYFALPGLRARNGWLLVVSLAFYAWGQCDFILLLLISTLLNYALGKWVERCEAPSERKLAVATAAVVNLGFLAWFKYAGLVVVSVNALLKPCGLAALPVPVIALPIGISFFTFHALSYIVDIYRRKARAAGDPRDTALYIFFFPQLVAGPILRWHAIAPQLEKRAFDRAVFAEGVRRFTGGLAKKMLVANAVAGPADRIFALPPSQLSAADAWLGLACYTIQIYFDFSGYSDMAVGLGNMFGFQFLENFNFPYVAQSLRDFWRRWHISLSTWFRDYVYIPLGGNRVSALRNHLNLVAVFFLCGLWHGASWTFVAWGLCHGMFLVLERTAWGAVLDRLPRPLRHAYTLLVVMMCWVLFRADSWSGALHYFAALWGVGPVVQAQPWQRYAGNEVRWALGAGLAFSLPLWAGAKAVVGSGLRRLPEQFRTAGFAAAQLAEMALVVGLLLLSAAWLASGTYNPFIYYRF